MKLEAIDGQNWEEFLNSPKAVLLIGKTDCAACNEWTAELTGFLQSGSAPQDVRFGKLLIDKPGLVSFKRANPWLKDVDVLPFTVLFQGGEQKKSFAGKGIERLTNRLDRLD
jgi:hypothetical protein